MFFKNTSRCDAYGCAIINDSGQVYYEAIWPATLLFAAYGGINGPQYPVGSNVVDLATFFRCTNFSWGGHGNGMQEDGFLDAIRAIPTVDPRTGDYLDWTKSGSGYPNINCQADSVGGGDA